MANSPAPSARSPKALASALSRLIGHGWTRITGIYWPICVHPCVWESVSYFFAETGRCLNDGELSSLD